MTTLTFTVPIELEKLNDVLKKLNEVTPNANLRVGLKNNTLVTVIDIFPAVPTEKKEEMEKLALDIGATLEM